jgi:hypothetical protein
MTKEGKKDLNIQFSDELRFSQFINKKLPRKRHAIAVNSNGSFKGEKRK